MARTVDKTGERYGRLVVLARQPREVKGVFWLCKCDCGNTTVAPSGHLNAGMRISCGCAMRESKRKHGRSHTPEHRCWSRMKERCYNESNKRFPHYGGRGIAVCDRWRDSFENFLADMGFRPSPKHSIDRVDNDGDYEPSNCRWATVTEQNNNRTFNRHLTLAGRQVTVAQASRLTGVNQATILSRLNAGYSDEEAIRHG